MVALNADGKINLLGRAAYADGYYSIAFNNPAILKRFIEKRQKDLSDKQQKWLSWAMQKISEQRPRQSLASNQ